MAADALLQLWLVSGRGGVSFAGGLSAIATESGLLQGISADNYVENGAPLISSCMRGEESQ